MTNISSADASKSLHNLPTILIGENHLDATSYDILLEMLPYLKKAGYQICCEDNHEMSLDNLIQFLRKFVDDANRSPLLTLYAIMQQKFVQDFKNRSVEVANLMKAYAIAKGDNQKDYMLKILRDFKVILQASGYNLTPQQIFQDANDSAQLIGPYLELEIVKKRITFLEKVKELGIPYQNIDLNLDRSKYSSEQKPEFSMAARDKFMAEQLQKKPSIAIIGSNHIEGILDHFSQGKSSNIKAFYVFGHEMCKLPEKSFYTIIDCTKQSPTQAARHIEKSFEINESKNETTSPTETKTPMNNPYVASSNQTVKTLLEAKADVSFMARARLTPLQSAVSAQPGNIPAALGSKTPAR